MKQKILQVKTFDGWCVDTWKMFKNAKLIQPPGYQLVRYPDLAGFVGLWPDVVIDGAYQQGSVAMVAAVPAILSRHTAPSSDSASSVVILEAATSRSSVRCHSMTALRFREESGAALYQRRGPPGP
jgi:hypothetical protein